MTIDNANFILGKRFGIIKERSTITLLFIIFLIDTYWYYMWKRNWRYNLLWLRNSFTRTIQASKEKIERLWINAKNRNGMSDFLTGRTQLLRVNGDRCDPGLVLSRIQQKSLLSSILFVNFTKDLLLIMWIPKCILLLTIQTDKLNKSYILTFRKSKAFSISYKNNDKILQRKMDIGGSVNINFSWKTKMATKISKAN